MIHHFSCSSHNCHKCSLYHSFLLWCPWFVYSKIIPNSFLSDSLSRTLVSPALSHLIIFTWILCLAFKPLIQLIIDSTCPFFSFKKKLFLYLLLHQPTLLNVVFLPFLVFSLMRYPNTSFLQDSHFYLYFSLGYSSTLFSPMISSGNCSPCLSSQPCNTLLSHPSNAVQHVLVEIFFGLYSIYNHCIDLLWFPDHHLG